jgi:hypothetical protein
MPSWPEKKKTKKANLDLPEHRSAGVDRRQKAPRWRRIRQVWPPPSSSTTTSPPKDYATCEHLNQRTLG